MTILKKAIIVFISIFIVLGCRSTKQIDAFSIDDIQHLINKGVTLIKLEPKRVYTFKKMILLDNVNGVTIDGQGAILKMDPSVPNNGNGFFRVLNSQNITIRNITLDGNRMQRDKGRYIPHNLEIYASHDIVLRDINSVNSLGDGIIISASPATSFNTFCTNIKVIDCHTDNSTRNGMSIVGTHNVQVLGGSYSNSNGADPMTGIDIEPDVGSKRPGAKNILIKGVKFDGNITAGLSILNSKTEPEDITVDSCFFSQSDFGIKSTGYDCIISNNNIVDCGTGIIGIRYEAESPREDHTQIFNNEISNVETGIDYRGYGAKIVNNKVTNASEHGIFLFGHPASRHSALVANNEIKNGGNHSGIGMRYFLNTTISGNTIDQMKRHGIVVSEGDYIIEGNSIKGSGFIGIELTGTNSTVKNNSISDATYAAIRFGKGGSKDSGGSVIGNKIGNVLKPGPASILDENGKLEEVSENVFTSSVGINKIQVKKYPKKGSQSRNDISIRE